jgi:hypothetical protein
MVHCAVVVSEGKFSIRPGRFKAMLHYSFDNRCESSSDKDSVNKQYASTMVLKPKPPLSFYCKLKVDQKCKQKAQ